MLVEERLQQFLEFPVPGVEVLHGSQNAVQVTGYFKEKVFRTIIPRNVRLSEAPSFAKPINLYDPECIGARSYQKLAEEVLLNV